MVRTEDTIPRLPRAAAELTRFRTGGLLRLSGDLLFSAGLSDVDFLIGGGCKALLVVNRSGLWLSCRFNGLLLIDPVVLALVSIESLLFFYVRKYEFGAPGPSRETTYVPLLRGPRLGNPAHQRQTLWAPP